MAKNHGMLKITVFKVIVIFLQAKLMKDCLTKFDADTGHSLEAVGIAH